MNAERYERLQALFLEARELPPLRREGFLERVARREPDLRAELDLLLSHDAPRGAESSRLVDALARGEGALVVAHFLEGLDPGRADGLEPALPRQLGRYTLVRRIGRGGMGEVYEALQDDPKRRVALKVIRQGMASDLAIERFRREAQMLGRLRHAGIARIYDAQTSPSGDEAPYFAMELVEGPPLTEFARLRELDVRRRLDLIAEVCDALEHAHRAGLVHRDLKPGNILVEPLPAPGSVDDGAARDSVAARIGGQPKILDFGIARSDDSKTLSGEACAGRLIGTLQYMSPEQVSGGVIDSRSDIYSLGVIAFELLAGRRPLDLSEKTIAEAARIIRDEDPARLGSIDRRLGGDVETIVAKALEKDPARRYRSAAALAADVRRHLRDEPIEARPPSALYRIAKFARRNRVVVGGALATFVALVSGGAVALKFAFDEHAVRGSAELSAYRASVRFAAAAIEAGEFADAAAQLARAPERLLGWEWRHFERQLDQSLASFDSAELDRVVDIEFSEDGRRVISALARGGVRAWDIESGAALAAAAATSGGDGARTFALGSHGETSLSLGPNAGPLRVRRTESGEVLREVRTTNPAIESATFSAASDRVALRRNGPGVEIVDTEGGATRTVGVIRAGGNFRFNSAFSPDGSLLAFGDTDGRVRVVNAISGAVRAVIREKAPAHSVTFSPDGSRLAVAYGNFHPSPGGGCVVHDLDSPGREIRIPLRSTAVGRLAFSPDGSRIAIGTESSFVDVRDAATGDFLASYRARDSFMRTVAFSPDGRLIAAGSARGSTKVFLAEPSPAESETLRGHTSYVYACAFSPDGSTIASGGWDDTVRLWDTASALEIAALRGHSDYVKTVEFDPSGRSLLSVSADRTYRLWDPRTGLETARFSEEGRGIRDVKFTPDGRLLVVAANHPTRKLATRDVRSGEIRAVASEAGGDVESIAVSPGGRTVATGWKAGRVRLYDLPSLALRRDAPGRGRQITSVAYSRDGARLAVGDIDGLVQVLNATTLEVEFSTRGHGSEVFAETFDASFSPDGARLAMGGRDGVLRVIDTTDGEIVAKLSGHGDYIYRLAWSPDGARIVTASGDKTLRLWETVPLRERLRARIDLERSRAAAAARVGALYSEIGDVEGVVGRLEAEPAPTEVERAAALQEALRQRPPQPAPRGAPE